MPGVPVTHCRFYVCCITATHIGYCSLIIQLCLVIRFVNSAVVNSVRYCSFQPSSGRYCDYYWVWTIMTSSCIQLTVYTPPTWLYASSEQLIYGQPVCLVNPNLCVQYSVLHGNLLTAFLECCIDGVVVLVVSIVVVVIDDVH